MEKEAEALDQRREEESLDTGQNAPNQVSVSEGRLVFQFTSRGPPERLNHIEFAA